MSRSRFGGFRVGKSRIFKKDELNAPSSTTGVVSDSATELDYTNAQGIWNLNSTVQFSKKSSGRTVVLGLSPSLFSTSGDVNSWSQKTVDISQYGGTTSRVVFKYTMIASVFTADIQLDAINIDGTTYSFENTGDSFQRASTATNSYESVSWESLVIGTTAARWNVDAGGTATSGTARTDAAAGSYYVYAETSSPGNIAGYTFWLRSPEISLSNSPSLSYYETRTGTDLGTLDVYLDVIS